MRVKRRPLVTHSELERCAEPSMLRPLPKTFERIREVAQPIDAKAVAENMERIREVAQPIEECALRIDFFLPNTSYPNK